MTWLRRYRLRQFLTDSIWVYPTGGMLAAMALAVTLQAIEQTIDLRSSYSAEGARAVLTTLAASMFTFIVFVSSTLLLAVQLASAQMTPRILVFMFRDRIVKFSLTVFVFAFTLLVAVLVRIDTVRPVM